MTISKEYFNQPLDRKAQHALKYEVYDDDVLPLWIADSDYKTSPAIIEALARHAQDGVFGYQLAEHTTALNDAVISWLERRHGWRIESEWLVWVPGIMVGVNSCCQLYTDNNLYIQTPNYPPILGLGDTHQLHTFFYNTYNTEQGWQLDFEALEHDLKVGQGGLLIITNPMNPCGNVLDKQSLERIGDLCDKYDIILCSDEVHCDLILDDNKSHIPAGSVSSLTQRSVTLMAVSKTFNLAGLATSFAIIPNDSLRRDFYRRTVKQQFWVNTFGMHATIAAFTQSDAWYDAQLSHLRSNRAKLAEGIQAIKGLDYKPSPATYLAWIDASGLKTEDVHQYFVERKLGLSPGAEFGNKDFVRLNFACPEHYIDQALERLATP
jgi:cystathionine beta-lyase